MKWNAICLIALPIALVGGFALGHMRGHTGTRTADEILYYVDPMHPSYRSSKPGLAPDCGMQLVPVYAKDAVSHLSATEGPANGAIQVDPATQHLYGIQVSKVERSAGEGTLRAFGRVEADQTRIYHVNLGAPGLVKETHDDAVGTHVSKDQHLAVIFSSEVLYAAAGYISGNERVQAGAMSDISPSAPRPSSVSARTDYLRNLGMSEIQIKELKETRKIPEDIYVVSPVDGFILSRNVSPNLRFDKNTELYSIVDLSHVWIQAEVYGKDAQAYRPGTVARITLADTGESFRAKVSDVLPQVDPANRASMIRLEVDNPKFHLRPEMFVNVDLPVMQPPGLIVPAEAVFDSGLSKRVFVQTSEGSFQPRQVETGWRLNGRVQIVKGLEAGESVVSAGTFLMDSESRLTSATNSNADNSGSAQGATIAVRGRE